MLYEEDTNRYRTYPQIDDPNVSNAHDHLKDVDFSKPTIGKDNKFNYVHAQTVSVSYKNDYEIDCQLNLKITAPSENPFKNLATSRLII